MADTKKTPSRKPHADAARRALVAAQARIGGAPWDEVAHVAGYANPQNAMRGVRQYFGSLPVMATNEQRQIWMARMERLWRYADRDARKGRPGAIRAGVAVAQRAAAMSGLDAPRQVQVDFEDPETVAALYAWLGYEPPRAIEADVVELPVLDVEPIDPEA